jgi:hypothetical protein
MTLNTAVVAPMPSAREIKAVIVNAGLFFSHRKPYRTSCQKFTIRAPLGVQRFI